MEVFKVPRREVHVRMLLDDGRALDGDLYTAPEIGRGRPESVLEHLNDTSEDFLPLSCGPDRFLLNKAGIVYVQLAADPAEADDVDLETGKMVPVRLSLAGGMALVGRFHIVMPAERSRVLDYLNSAGRFLPLWGDGLLTVVQRSFVVTVRGEPRGE